MIDSAKALMSAPAEKNLPSPVITTALTDASESVDCMASAILGKNSIENDWVADLPAIVTKLIPSPKSLTVTAMLRPQSLTLTFLTLV